MLTGRLPYNVGLESEYDLMNEIVNTPIKNPLDYYPHISPGVVKMIYHMTAKEKLERYAHCEEYLDFHLRPAGDEKQSPSQKVSSGAASFVLLLVLTGIVVLLFIFGNDLSRMIKGDTVKPDSTVVDADSVARAEYERLQKEKREREKANAPEKKKDTTVQSDTAKPAPKTPPDEEVIPADSSN